MIEVQELREVRELHESEESAVLLVAHPQLPGQCVLKVRRELDLERWKNAARLHGLFRKDPRFQGLILNPSEDWMLLEYVEGVCLREYHENRDFKSWESFRTVALDICDAVAHLHKLGVIHKDLKPENIIHRLDGGIAIIDFGAAFYEKRATKVGDVGPLTEKYASEGQKAGLPPVPAFDVHQLAVMFSELSTGLSVPTDVLGVFRRCESSIEAPPLEVLIDALQAPPIAKEPPETFAKATNDSPKAASSAAHRALLFVAGAALATATLLLVYLVNGPALEDSPAKTVTAETPPQPEIPMTGPTSIPEAQQPPALPAEAPPPVHAPRRRVNANGADEDELMIPELYQ